MILQMWERTTIGLMCSSATQFWPFSFEKGISLPAVRYSGTIPSFMTWAIWVTTLSKRAALYARRVPSKRSGPRALLKLQSLKTPKPHDHMNLIVSGLGIINYSYI